MNQNPDLRKAPNTIKIEVDVHKLANFLTLYDEIKGYIEWPGFFDTNLEMEDYEIKEAFEDAITDINKALRTALLKERD